jgi:D-beta-D-heptose 7-phosphate kinase/D-beta-D-heptose 1-phosphate adenosyltransferase
MPPSHHLVSSLEKFAQQHVLCIGDVMLDDYIYGRVERVSAEAPIPIICIERNVKSPGGAANVICNLTSLGGHADAIGVIGEDQAGHDLIRLISEQLNATPQLVTAPNRPTTVKTRYISSGQQMLRADIELAQPVSAAIEDQLIHRIRAAVADCSVIILSDYAKGTLTPRVIAETIAIAGKLGRRVLVDPKGRDFMRYRGASILTPNRKELTEISGMTITTAEDAERASRQLIEKLELTGGILAKLGGDGVCLVMKDKPAQVFSSRTQEVFDVSGAGDTVIATFALALAGGLTEAEAAELANVAGSIVVGKVGTASVSRNEILHQLLYTPMQSNEQKLVTRDEAVEIAERWRQQGYKVGFTNGCFDLLHTGHVSLIRQARAACDRLIMGLNTDASVRRLKGETRPVNNESSRAAVLAALADIDLIVLFGEDTPYDLIKILRPDILVKGADYTVETVVGADLVQSWGGKVVLANLIEGQSTTGTITKLQKGKVA